MAMKKKSSLGRQKIPIEKIHKKSHLQVTFSKRRAGLFKKASELCTLCGVEIGMIVFSPANKPFSYGHPEVESLFHRFLAGNASKNDDASSALIEAHRNANVCDLNFHLSQVLNQLEAEKKHGYALDEMRNDTRRECWWAAPVNELGLQELEQVRAALEELKKNVATQINQVLIDSVNNHSQMWGANDCINAASTDPENVCIANKNAYF